MSKTGITYYKLEDVYPGDITKGCGLTGSEIDKNFHFLRGYDIKNATINEEEGTIVLERLNCEDIVIEGVREYIKEIAHTEELNLSGTTYDKENGVLHIFINGEESIAVEGFYTHVVGGEGIKGSGTHADPLRVDGLLLTGFFAPVKTFLDYEKEEKLPNKGDKGDRYLTREYVSPYGLEYTYNGLKKIEETLKEENHGWRVPTVEDWDEMLNQLECEEFRNHDNLTENSENGKLAGFLLKDAIWEEEIIGTKGFKVLPTEFDRKNKKYTTFWTSSNNGKGGQHAKSFHEGKGTIQHRVENTDDNNLWSIRLVRDIDTPFLPSETINGVVYNCVQLKSVNKKGEVITKSWTIENATFEKLIQDDEAKRPTIYDEGSFKFYLNEWNSVLEQWEKREFIDNDIVTIKSYSGYTDEAFVLKDGELIPYFNNLYIKVKEYVDAKVAAEAAERMAADEALDNKINAEIAQRTAEVKDLSERLMAEGVERRAEDAALSQRIANEGAERRAEDAALSQRIATEAAERKTEDAALSQRISTEAAERQAEDAALSQRIATEAAERQAEDAALSQRIATEAAERQAEDAALSQRIQQEATTRQSEDNRIETKVDIEIAERKAECESLSNRIIEEAVERARQDDALSQRIIDEATERINHDIQIKQYNATTKGVTINTNDGTEFKITFDGSFGKIDFYNA